MRGGIKKIARYGVPDGIKGFDAFQNFLHEGEEMCI